ncbi:MAG: hypothetical protein KAT34_19515 [Candidatus Aminicenantes bacterium]|nr:hypothetical protein [Candidatus Aminicenantes bacterium]
MNDEEAKITYKIFNNCSYNVYYGIGSEPAGQEVEKGKGISETIIYNEKLFVWAAKDETGPPQDCNIYFPMKVDEYEADNYELKVAQRAKKFILSGEPGQRKNAEVLVSVCDPK